MSSEALINAELTIGSLMVLGFNPFTYMDTYSGLSGLSQLTVYSFDKQNEKFLMVVLHFLLGKLDQEEFPSSVEFCFPYFDMKTKNEYKRAVIHSFERLVEQNLLTSGICKSSLLSLAKGPEIWSLLRVLSDLCVEFELAEIKGEDISSIALKYYESIDIQECIEEELRQIEEVIIEGIQQEKENCNYFNELDGRLRKATKTIEQARKKLHTILVNDVPLQVLTESGRLQRSEWIEKITKSKQLLSGLAHSPLLAKARELLEADREAMERGALAIQNQNKIASMTPERWEEMNKHASEALMGPDLVEQRLVLDAVSQLVEQIDQILVV